MERIPEPELMLDAQQARACAQADLSGPNGLFCELFARRCGPVAPMRVLDLGCGPADIPLRLAAEHPELRIDAVDGSEPMLAHGRRAVEHAGAADRVTLHCATLDDLDAALGAVRYDAVVSNSLLHLLRDPDLLWREVRGRTRPGGAVLVMDPMRPASEADVVALCESYVAGEPAVLQRDFEASLRAAFRLGDEAPFRRSFDGRAAHRTSRQAASWRAARKARGRDGRRLAGSDRTVGGASHNGRIPDLGHSSHRSDPLPGRTGPDWYR